MRCNLPLILFVLCSGLSLSGHTLAESDHYESALQAYNQGDINTAYIHLKNALQEKETNLPAKLLYAQVLNQRGSYSLAEQELINALKLGADINLVIKPLGESLLYQGRYNEALQLDDKQNLNQLGQQAFCIIKANAYQALKKIDEAIIEYQAALQYQPENVDARLGLSSLYIFTNNYSKANDLLTDIHLLAPNNSKSWRLKGELARSQNQLNQAINYFLKSQSVNPDDLDTLSSLAKTYMAIEEYYKAESIIEQSLTIRSFNPQLQMLKSDLLLKLNKPEQANQVLAELSNQLSSINQDYILSQPHLLLTDAMSSYKQKNWKQARSKFELYLSHTQTKSESDISAVMLLADTHIQLDGKRDALELLSKHEKEMLDYKDYALTLAGLYIDFSKRLEADMLLDTLRERYPHDETLMILSAKALTDIGQTERALNLLQSAEEYISSPSEHFNYTLALILFKQNLLSKSLGYSQSLADQFPEQPRYALLQSQTLLRLNQKEKADLLIEQLYKKHPKDRNVKYHFALLQKNKGQYKQAQSLLRELVSENEFDHSAWFLLAETEYKLGNISKTIGILEKQATEPTHMNMALHQLADIHFIEQDYKQSLLVINDLLKIDGLDQKAILMKSKCLIELERFPQADKQLGKLLGFWSEDPRKLLQLSKLQIQTGNFIGSEETLTLAYKLAPKALPVIIDLIKSKIRLRKISEAKQNLNTGFTLYPQQEFLIILQGDIAVIEQDLEAGFNDFLQVLEKEKPNSMSIALMKMTQISYKEPLVERFTKVLESLVNKHPEEGLYRNVLADHFLVNKQYAKAKSQYQKLITTKNIPWMKRGLALNNLATIHIRDKEYKNAVQLAKQALQISGLGAPIVDTYGWALTLSGDLKQGLAHLRQAYTLSSSTPEIQYHLAYTLVKLERASEAKPILEKLMLLPNDYEEYSEAEALLKSLK